MADCRTAATDDPEKAPDTVELLVFPIGGCRREPAKTFLLDLHALELGLIQWVPRDETDCVGAVDCHGDERGSWRERLWLFDGRSNCLEEYLKATMPGNPRPVDERQGAMSNNHQKPTDPVATDGDGGNSRDDRAWAVPVLPLTINGRLSRAVDPPTVDCLTDDSLEVGVGSALSRAHS